MASSSRKNNKKIIVLTAFFAFVFLLGPASASAIGERVSFNVDPSYDTNGRDHVEATFYKDSNKIYFYVEQEWLNSLNANQQITLSSAVDNLASEYENNIYPKMISVFGSEWNPGIDNDSKLTVLITRLKDNAGGYFNTFDEYSKSKIPTSNEREMIYLNSVAIGDPLLPSYLAHEFQHLISFYQKNKLRNMEDDVWLNEARSELAITIAGYDAQYAGSHLEKRVKRFLTQSTEPLAEWKNDTIDYAAVNLFMQYLVGRFGNRLITEMMSNDKVGIESVNAALALVGSTGNFSELFGDWAVANYLNNCDVSLAGHYCYNGNLLNFVRLRIDPSSYSLDSGRIDVAAWVKDWSPRWYKINSASSSSRDLRINFESFGVLADFGVNYILEENGQYKVSSVHLDSSKRGSLLISGFGSRVQSVVIIPFNRFKKSSFTSNDPVAPFSIEISTAVVSGSLTSGSLAKTDTDARVYLIDGGARRWIPSAEIFIARGYKWNDIKIVSFNEISLYPDGKEVMWPDGTLIKSSQYSAVYVISSEKKREFISADIFSSLGYNWQNIRIVAQADIEKYENGAPISQLLHPDGALVRFSDSPNIYLIEGGKKRLVTSLEAFLAKKYDFNLVVVVVSQLRAQYPDGQGVY